MDFSEVKELILWAKMQKIKKLSVQGVEVEFSELAFIDSFDVPAQADNKNSTQSEVYSAPANIYEDPDLFHSSGS